MGLTVNTNIAAMNAYRNLSSTNDQMAKALEKLSSGYRINRAADDAAGLAISEGLKSQIGGLKMAVRNTQDGISVVQTAEGALTESHSILQRMRELAVQAANDAVMSPMSKQNIQAEIVQLKSELDRIANTTQFNGQQLLDGTFTGKVFQVGSNAGETISIGIGSRNNGLGSEGLGIAGMDVTRMATASTTYQTAAVTATAATTTTAGSVGITAITTTPATVFSGAGGLEGLKGLNGTISFGGKTLDLGSVDYGAAIDDVTALAALNTAAKTAFGLTVDPFSTTASVLTFSVTEAVPGYTAASGYALTAAAADLVGATPGFSQSTGAATGLAIVDTAVNMISTLRANLGAIQNRFEHTIANLNVAVENLSASNSRIRDTDMAVEMSNFTRTQILSQAGTSMLAQANQVPQSILKLLGN